MRVKLRVPTKSLTSVACTTKILQSQITLLEKSVSDTTIWSIPQVSSIMILEASFTLLYYIHYTGIFHIGATFEVRPVVHGISLLIDKLEMVDRVFISNMENGKRAR